MSARSVRPEEASQSLRGGRKAFPLLLCALLAALAIGALTAAPNLTKSGFDEAQAQTSAPTVLARTLSGAYVGAGDRAGFSNFEAFRGEPLDFALDFLDRSSWAAIDDPSSLLAKWGPGGQGPRLVLSVPMLPDQPDTSLEAGAGGAYDSHFTELARALVADGRADTTIRLGWEANGWWYPWAASRQEQQTPGSGAADYIRYWQQIVSVMKATPGAHFTFDWSSNLGDNTIDAAELYPGDQYVDYIGVTIFDIAYDKNGDKLDDPTKRWDELQSGHRGLDYWADFASDHGKPLTVPEWGLVNDPKNAAYTGDDAAFVTDMYRWMADHHPAYESFFNFGAHALVSNTPGQPAPALQASNAYWYASRDSDQ